MKLRTTIGWGDYWLRGMTAYCCEQIGDPFERLNGATYSRCHHAPFRGRAFPRERSIRGR